ncbi:origin of replication complex subunit 3 [Tripterygium wilfordii]|uniref:origin of replication complex subunit 3 n=1 Tax=Tripterygium wilfordii TaxID=458696 RepID=UPI0018F815F3|nr:origin of replication complex subunit 3 [Tripterygium wilfordii]
MASSATVADSPAPPNPDNIQPFFVIHKAFSRKSKKKSPRAGKAKRKIDLSPLVSKNAKKADEESVEECDSMRMEYFGIVWSKIETTIKNVLRDMNINVFSDIHHWVRESFNTIRSSGPPSLTEATCSFPFVKDTTLKKLFTGLVLTKNMEFVDDLLTFEDLGLHLKSHGCHVANLSSLDFLAKNGIGGCLRSLLRQFLMVSLDAADISILASWYREHDKYNNPVVIIIDDMERCCGSILSDFILMLSEWAIKIPVILIMGISTMLDAPSNALTSNALQHLFPCKFILGTPAERMDAVVAAVLVGQPSTFSISHKVAAFMRNYFVSQDGTLTSFVRALKIACVQHFYVEPLSFVLRGFLLQEDCQEFQVETNGLLPETMLKKAFDLPSCERNKKVSQTSENLIDGLSELKRLQKLWSIVVLCLYDAAKYGNIRLLDILCEALNPELYNSRGTDAQAESEKDSGRSPSNGCFMDRQYPSSRKDGFINKVVRIVKDLPRSQLYNLLKSWEERTADIIEIHEDVKELLFTLKSEEHKRQKQRSTSVSKRHISRAQLNMERDSQVTNEKAATLIDRMIRDYMHPLECVPFHEIICFKNVDKLQLALVGDPRRRIQVDLLESHKILQCNCCNRKGSTLLPSMHDTSIMYNLAQEHGDLINLLDWYQSFKSVVLCPGVKRKRKSKQKCKDMNEPQKQSEVSIQARYCRAVTELQITGLLRMPSKRRPDFAQRVAFGL